MGQLEKDCFKTMVALLNHVLFFCSTVSFFLLLVNSSEIDRIGHLEALLQLQGEKITALEAQKGNCICNLGSLKRGIRKNSIAISQVKNFALHNDNRIQKNLDKINENMVDMTTTKILRTCHEL